MKLATLRTNLFTFLCRAGLTIAFVLLAASMVWGAPLAHPPGAETASDVVASLLPVAGARPVRLQIPSLKIDAVIEAVGSDQNGAMGIPKQADNVAWYAPGYLPGEWGNAVIAGHLDLANGAPAIFWSLGQLVVGDSIIVTAADGTQYHFAVTGQATYPYDQAPIEEIFGFSLQSQLNLITCKGQWNRGTRNYTKRLVVYSALVETVKGSGRAWMWETPVAPPLPFALVPSLPIPNSGTKLTK